MFSAVVGVMEKNYTILSFFQKNSLIKNLTNNFWMQSLFESLKPKIQIFCKISFFFIDSAFILCVLLYVRFTCRKCFLFYTPITLKVSHLKKILCLLRL